VKTEDQNVLNVIMYPVTVIMVQTTDPTQD